MATRLAARVRARLGRELPIRTIFETPVLGELARVPCAPVTDETAPLVARPEDRHAPFPLTPVQEAYWLGRQRLVELGEVACHVYAELRLRALDVERMSAAWRAVIARHPTLRAVVGADGAQRVLGTVPPFEVAFAERVKRRRRRCAPRCRAKCCPATDGRCSTCESTQVAPDEWRLHLSIDALILDGESNNLLLQEVLRRLPRQRPPQPAEHADVPRLCAAPAGAVAGRRSGRAPTGRRGSIPCRPPPRCRWRSIPRASPIRTLRRQHARLVAKTWTSAQGPRGRRRADAVEPAADGVRGGAGHLGALGRLHLNLTVGDRRLAASRRGGDAGRLHQPDPAGDPRRAAGAASATRAQAQQRQLATDLDHRAVSGVEVQRMLARRAGDRTRRAPAGRVHERDRRSAGEAAGGPGGRARITETPQTWLDNEGIRGSTAASGSTGTRPRRCSRRACWRRCSPPTCRCSTSLRARTQAWEAADRTLVPAEQRQLYRSA